MNYSDAGLEMRTLGQKDGSLWVKALAAKLDNLSSIPRTHLVEGKNGFLKLSSILHVPTMARMCARTHTHKMNTCLKCLKDDSCAGDIVQQLRALPSVLAEDLSSIPSTHM